MARDQRACSMRRALVKNIVHPHRIGTTPMLEMLSVKDWWSVLVHVSNTQPVDHRWSAHAPKCSFGRGPMITTLFRNALGRGSIIGASPWSALGRRFMIDQVPEVLLVWDRLCTVNQDPSNIWNLWTLFPLNFFNWTYQNSEIFRSSAKRLWYSILLTAITEKCFFSLEFLRRRTLASRR